MNDLTQVACDPTRSVVVQASAGSGKTWLLTSRIFRLLLAGSPANQILAITFTRKAAQEMRQRLADLLRLCALASDAELSALLSERGATVNLENLHKARSLAGEVLTDPRGVTIDTFHGWFGSLCQLAPLGEAISRQAEPVDDAERLIGLTVQDFLSGLMSRDAEPSLREALATITQLLDRADVDQLLRSMLSHRLAIELWLDNPDKADLHQWFELSVGCRWPEDVMQNTSFVEGVAQLASWLGKGTESQQAKAVELETALTNWRTTNNASEACERLCKVLLTAAKAPSKQVKPNKTTRASGIDDDAFIELVATVQASLSAAYRKIIDVRDLALTEAAVVLFAPLCEAYSALKVSLGYCDFDDLERSAMRLLLNPEQQAYMQQKLDQRVSHLLVDEFQDTNPVQWNVLRLWLEGYSAGEQPTVFLVGDPKQSIYRFRRAEARLFGKVSQWLQQRFNAVELSANHSRRCLPQVLNVVNRVFTTGSNVGSTQFLPHQFLGRLPESNTVGLTVYPLVLSAADQAEQGLPSEARLVASQISVMVANQELTKLSDMMVLVKAHSSAYRLAIALREVGIPFELKDRGERYKHLIWRDTMALLAVLDCPDDDVSLLHLLRSPLFGCASAQLSQILGGIREGCTLWSYLNSGHAPPFMAKATECINSWLSLANQVPLFDVINNVIDDCNPEKAYLAVVPAAERNLVAGHWEWLKDWALSVNRGRFPNLADAWQSASDLLLYGASDGEADSSDSDRLRIFTVHSSKGLEAQHVWLFDANRETKPSGSSLTLLQDWAPSELRPKGISVIKSDSVNSPGRAGTLAAEQQAIDDETDHLLYVALTRAKQHIHLSGTVDRSQKKAWYQRLLPFADRVLEKWPKGEGVDLSSVATATDESIKWQRKQWPEIDHALQLVGKSVPRIYSAQLSMGTALHRTLEWVDSEGLLPFEQYWTNRLQDCQSEFAQLTKGELLEVRECLEGLLGNPELKPFFQEAELAHNELEWVQEDGALCRADRVVYVDGCWCVLDYKWSVDSSNLAKYSQQVLHYMKLVDATLKSPSQNSATKGALIDRHGKVHWVSSV